ncbi:hypothetical protein EFP34_04895 [Lacticaseibacillus paracasei]|nr:hypothetical protein [Lacticaseibacillus paracasei]
MVLMLKRAHSRSNLRVRTLAAMAKVRPSRPRSLTLRLLTAPARALLKRARQPRNLHISGLGCDGRVSNRADSRSYFLFLKSQRVVYSIT